LRTLPQRSTRPAIVTVPSRCWLIGEADWTGPPPALAHARAAAKLAQRRNLPMPMLPQRFPRADTPASRRQLLARFAAAEAWPHGDLSASETKRDRSMRRIARATRVAGKTLR
jgi:hypothetical protein